MLVLRRKIGESLKVGNAIIHILGVDSRGQIKIGIQAPDDVLVIRSELLPPWKLLQERTVLPSSRQQ